MRPFALSRVPFGAEDWFGWDALTSDHDFRGFWSEPRGFKASLSDMPVICNDPHDAPEFGRTPTKPDDAHFLGSDKAPAPLPTTPLALTIDMQAGDTSTTATIAVDGSHIVSTLELPGDFDFFRVELQQGEIYNIGQYLVAGGPSGVPLADAYIELYDDQGNLIVTADGGGPNTPSGLDALLTFEAEYTGVYFINARAFDQEPANGADGDFVGDYELFVDRVDPNDPNAYRPLYSPDQPMHSIDWGSQVDRTSRNPDGDNGPRDNGAPDMGVTYNAQFDISGKNVITYYFAKTGDVFVDENPADPGLATMVAKGMAQWEKDAFRTALDEYEKVTDNVYIEVGAREEADFKFITYNGTPGVGASVLGRMSPPNEANEGQAEFNAGDVRWTEAGLQQGGFYFPTLLHELGHGHGMAHPHDNGGRSSIMRGAGPSEDPVEGAIGGQYGDFGLSQQVFTIMSYNDGWSEDAGRPAGQGGPRSGGITGAEVDHYGWVGTLSALDIAVLQDKYGVNEDYATGNDVYTIKDENGPGNFYSCIWDAAGTDEIKYAGARDANIDLRAATLKYEEGGGGWISFAMGAWTGFTIANGVTIENASGGDGADVLGGNDAANRLTGGNGDDMLDARAGNDIMDGGAGNDTLIGGLGTDVLRGGLGDDTLNWSAADGRDTLDGGDGADTLNATGGDAAEVAQVNWNGTAVTNLLGNAVIGIESVNLDAGAGADWLSYNTTAGVSANLSTGSATGFASVANIENVIGGSGNDFLTGNASANKLTGGDGADVITGGGAADSLTGGLGNDTFVYAPGAGADTITDFDANAAGGQDVIDVSTFGIDSLNFATRVAIIDAGAETVVRVDDVFITLKGVTGEGDNVITGADFLFG
ncbi:MAG TPA: M10 family metallopeptidase C-terminal domain-containing protein [Candidatus Binatia bacterium]|nr:M10 family metallopeptidase C-terminal domain-containing protein [Candidatus Binatia bacterium]